MADQDPMQQANDMNDLIAQAAQVQADLQKAQEEILATNVEGQAGNGLVKVTMTGGAELVDLQIDKSVVDPEDVDTLQDLVMGAFKESARCGRPPGTGEDWPAVPRHGRPGRPVFEDVFGGNQ